MSSYYNICRKCMGKPVLIRTKDGHIHRGIVRQVSPQHVHLQTLGHSVSTMEYDIENIPAHYAIGTNEDVTGTEVFYFPIIPLAAIAGITLIGVGGLFWW